MDLLRSVTDCVNRAKRPMHEPDYFDRNTTEIAFFHNLCIIRKEPNAVSTNVPNQVERERQAMALSRTD
jgi:hypothetical protein